MFLRHQDKLGQGGDTGTTATQKRMVQPNTGFQKSFLEMKTLK
jgi:hypothetical protein